MRRYSLDCSSSSLPSSPSSSSFAIALEEGARRARKVCLNKRCGGMSVFPPSFPPSLLPSLHPSFPPSPSCPAHRARHSDTHISLLPKNLFSPTLPSPPSLPPSLPPPTCVSCGCCQYPLALLGESTQISPTWPGGRERRRDGSTMRRCTPAGGREGGMEGGRVDVRTYLDGQKSVSACPLSYN